MACRICSSQYCNDINNFIQRGYKPSDIAKKYLPLFPGSSYESFYVTVRNHKNDKHIGQIPDPVVQAELDKVRIDKGPGNTFEGYSERLLAVGMSEDMMKPGKVSHSHIIAAERTKIEKEKLQLQVNAQKMLIIKFLRGLPDLKQQSIEGEINGDNIPLNAGSDTVVEANTD